MPRQMITAKSKATARAVPADLWNRLLCAWKPVMRITTAAMPGGHHWCLKIHSVLNT